MNSVIYLFLLIFLVFLSGMAFVVLGKFSYLMFGSSWWEILKDLSSVLASITTVLALPIAFLSFQNQKNKDRMERETRAKEKILEDSKDRDERARQDLERIKDNGDRICEEVISALDGDVISKKQIIKSALHRFELFTKKYPELYEDVFSGRMRANFNSFLTNLSFSTLSGKDYIKPSEYDLGLDVNGSLAFTAEIFSMAYSYREASGYFILSIGGEVGLVLQDRDGGLGSVAGTILELAQPNEKHLGSGITEDDWVKSFIVDGKWYEHITVLSYIYLTKTQAGLKLLSDIEGGDRTIDFPDFVKMSPSEQSNLYKNPLEF